MLRAKGTQMWARHKIASVYCEKRINREWNYTHATASKVLSIFYFEEKTLKNFSKRNDICRIFNDMINNLVTNNTDPQKMFHFIKV